MHVRQTSKCAHAGHEHMLTFSFFFCLLQQLLINSEIDFNTVGNGTDSTTSDVVFAIIQKESADTRLIYSCRDEFLRLQVINPRFFDDFTSHQHQII